MVAVTGLLTFKYTGFIRKHGCGVRLNEGASLALNDLQQDRKVLHVREGKHYKKRFVPVAQKNFEEIILCIKYARPQLLQEIKTDALFIDANKGRPMHKQSLYVRIKKLVNKANIKKKADTHTLRHSIATHLLQSGMKPERIKDFLGRILTARRSIHIYQMKCNELQSVFTAMQIQPCNH